MQHTEDKYGETGGSLIVKEEMESARHFMETALRLGASQARISLSKSVLDSFSVLNGELDKVTHAADRSIYMYIFAEGRYGTFSTNMTDADKAEDFVGKAIETVKMLAPDPHRRLPAPARTAKDALTGREAGLYDEEYGKVTSEERLAAALSGALMCGEDKRKGGLTGTLVPEKDRQADKNGAETGMPAGDNWKMISEECEYSDSVDDNYTIDSQGFAGRHTETSFAFCSEVTIADKDGNRFSGYWWESSPFRGGLDLKDCSAAALRKAVSQIGPKRHRSGKYSMVVDRSVSSRLVSPLFSALNAMAIQQKNSFLDGSLGQKIFPEGMTIMDLARSCGRPGSRLFDTEGVATADAPVILDGVVKEYFVNTYMASKTGFAPTIEGVSRPVLMPFIQGRNSTGTGLVSEEKEVSLQDILRRCGSGIYVCGFNGGNCNQTTGDFSYGIEGFAFKDGKITHPVREMVITGNMISLWNSLLAAGSDARACTRWQIPTLAFEGVDFSA